MAKPKRVEIDEGFDDDSSVIGPITCGCDELKAELLRCIGIHEVSDREGCACKLFVRHGVAQIDMNQIGFPVRVWRAVTRREVKAWLVEECLSEEKTE